MLDLVNLIVLAAIVASIGLVVLMAKNAPGKAARREFYRPKLYGAGLQSVLPFWLVVLAIASILSWTPALEVIALLGALFIIGLPITFAIFLLPTVTLALAVLFYTNRGLGLVGVRHGWLLGAALVGVFAAIPSLWIAPRAADHAERFRAEDIPMPVIQPDGVLALRGNTDWCDRPCLRALSAGLDGVLMLSVTGNAETGTLFTLHDITTPPCDALAPEAKFLAAIRLSRPELATCIRIEQAQRDAADLLWEETNTYVPDTQFGMRKLHVTQHTLRQKVAGAFVVTGRVTGYSYEVADLPILTDEHSYELNIDFRPGLMHRRVWSSSGLSADPRHLFPDKSP
ncbi:hypothetical protein [Marivita sp. S2033]|uniref:hypothetical protein n=1 Tax=Marivita sp. S2033 TaxID=3373187 RepID=UPI0039824E96